MSEQEFNRLFAKNLTHYLSKQGMTQAELAEKMNVSTATASNWCKGIKLPRMDKVDRICTILSISRSDLMEDNAQKRETAYYLDKESSDAAQFLFDNPEYKVLFDASRKVKPQDIQYVADLINRVSGNSDDTGC